MYLFTISIVISIVLDARKVLNYKIGSGYFIVLFVFIMLMNVFSSYSFSNYIKQLISPAHPGPSHTLRPGKEIYLKTYTLQGNRATAFFLTWPFPGPSRPQPTPGSKHIRKIEEINNFTNHFFRTPESCKSLFQISPKITNHVSEFPEIYK